MLFKGWKRNQIDTAGILACVILAMLGYFFGIHPLLRQQESLHARQSRLDAQNDQARELTDALGKLKGKLSFVRQALASSPVRLESDYRLNPRIAAIAELVSDCGMRINEIRPGVLKSEQRFKTMPISVSGSGSYPGCILLLKRLKQAFPDTAIESFKILSNTSDPRAGAQYQVDLLWYVAAKKHSQKDQ